MEEKALNILEETFINVMENMAFIFPERIMDAAIPDDFLSVSIEFKGPVTGCIRIICDIDICNELAANILGVDEEEQLSIPVMEDALKETLNTLCGRFLTGFAGREPVFNLSSPEAKKVMPDLSGLDRSSEALWFVVDDRPIAIILSLD